MKFLRLILASLVLLISNNALALERLSQEQIKNLQKAYNYGKSKPFKVNGRLDSGYIMAAIMWQESSAGINCGNSSNVVGPYQNLVTTVKSRMHQDGIKKSRSQIARELVNHNTSAHWANIEIKSWLDVHKGDISKALASYNAGWKVHKGAGYSRSVLRRANYLKDNNILKVE